MDFNPDSLMALSRLLNPPKIVDDLEDDDDDIRMPRGASKPIFSNPGDVSKSKGPVSKEEKRDLKRQERTKNANPKDIWDPEEVLPSQEYDDKYDARPQPEHNITYRQTLSTDDVYLQMGNKNPSTASCEFMVVRIELPGTKNVSEIELNITKTFLDCRTKTHKLGLHLPHFCDDKSAKAEWNTSKNELSIALRMTRDFDDFNL